MQRLISLLLIIEQSSPLPTLLAQAESWGLAQVVIGLIAIFVTILGAVLPRPWLTARLSRRSTMMLKGASSHPGLQNKDAFSCFVQPKCREVCNSCNAISLAVDGNPYLFDILDNRLDHPEFYKHLILLADSGMGKTTALLNYFRRHAHRWENQTFELAIIELSLPHSDSLIEAIEDKANTVLLLDTLDESCMSVVDPLEHLQRIIDTTQRFRCVLIACRTQFFSNDEEIPEDTGIGRVGGINLGETTEHHLHKIYLLPFDNLQVKKLLRKRSQFWKRGPRERGKIFKLIRDFPRLAERPMLLAYTRYLVNEKFKFSHEVYEKIVNAWIIRETKETSALRQFSEQLAVYLFLNRESQESQKISKGELAMKAKEWECKIDYGKLSRRSLFTKDAIGDFKFADSSIMEHLFVCRFFQGDAETLQKPWTDQMHLFLWERVVNQWELGAPWFAEAPFKLFLEHANGIDTLLKAHALFCHQRKARFARESRDQFGVSLIAKMLRMSNHAKPYIKLLRIEKITYSPKAFRNKTIKFAFSSGAYSLYGDKLSYGAYSRPDPLTLYYYEREFSEIEFAGSEAVKEFPQEDSNCFFSIVDHWLRRAFRIRTDSGTEVILAFQTVTPVDRDLIAKITRCASVLF
jgi:hypothetical protein